MLNRISEKTMHRVRWLLTLGWLTLIASFFFDPLTVFFTQPNNLASPFHLHPEIYLDPEKCVKIREVCMPEQPFAMGALIWWAMIVPTGIFILLVLGHEFWRRICPLSFLSQIPRALGIQRRRRVVDPVTGDSQRELVTITPNSWLGRNHLYVQFSLFVLGLGGRILWTNSDRIALGCFLIASILCAIVVGYLYAGKSWCQYFCPMAPVQMVYTGPRSLLGSQAHVMPKPAVTQSMCRTWDEANDRDRSACVNCKQHCVDIDAEKTYWMELKKPGRRLVQYGYLGMVIAFYLYYYLYAGNWAYYFSGAWTHEEDQVSKLWDSGFFIHDTLIPIPKAFAVFITFAVLISLCRILGWTLEKLVRRYASRSGRPISAQQTQHIVFTLFTAAAFWTFFSYGARPTLNRLPPLLLLGFNALIVLVGAMWLYRTLGRTRSQYEREEMATSLRKQLQKLPLDPALLGKKQIEDLTSEEVYILMKVISGYSQQLRWQTYKELVQDLLEQQVVTTAQSFEFFKKLRADLQLSDADHFAALEAIATTHPDILQAAQMAEPETAAQDTITLAKTIGNLRRSPRAPRRPSPPFPSFGQRR